ncbi:MAG: class C sortase [Acutalibacteraceae bacterium]|nr:class C sortase [Acutalibacteraceae bacterium]
MKLGLKILTAIATIMFVTGLGLVLFPPISNSVGKAIANNEIEKFDQQISNIAEGSFEEALEKGEIDKEGYPIDENGNRTSDLPLVFVVECGRMQADSIAYNENLKENQSQLLTSETYQTPVLNLLDYGVITNIYGYVSAPSIDMQLPVYLGASDYNMSYGVAHMSYTSLPTGGESTNTVIAGHTGYIGRIYFDKLRYLQIGDSIEFTNYWGKLNYRVAETKIVDEKESSDIYIKDGEDLLTLVTCISDKQGGFDRYLVICERAE